MDLDNFGQIQQTHPHIVQNVRKILTAVRNKESICLTGIPKVGINRIIDSVVNTLGEESFEVIYDIDHTLTLDKIRQKLNKRNKSKQILLVLPFLQSENNEFLVELSGILQRLDKNKITVLSHISLMQYLSLKQNLKNQTKLYSLIDIIKPLSPKQTEQMVLAQFSEQIKNKKIIGRIFNLSGGIAGLVKRLCNYFLYYGNLDDTETIAKYIPIHENLSEIIDEIKILPVNILREFGVLDDKGSYISQLIELVINNQKIISKRNNSLTGNEKLIFDLLLRNINTVVNIDAIDKVLREAEFFSFWGNYRAISRLRKKISKEFEIKNVKGKGYMLVRKDGN